MIEAQYYVQCISGNTDHIREVVPGSQLESRCKQNESAGRLDAFILGTNECEACIEDARAAQRREKQYIADFGCPMADIDDNCPSDCPCKQPQAIPDSPYDGQTRYVTQQA